MARTEAPQDPRPYVRISTDLPLNPKLAEIDNPAAGWAYVVSLCYSGQSLTDGHFSITTVCRLAGVDKAIATALVEQGLWHLPGHDCERCPQPKAGQAYLHDYLQHQRSADEARDLTSKRREAGRKGAERRWSKVEPDAKSDGNPMANAMASAEQVPWQMDSKTMAEESRGEESRKESGARKRGTRLPENFSVTPDMVTWARDTVPQVDGRHETEKFRNHWLGESGAAASKVDWVRAWKKWMLRASEYTAQRSQPHQAAASNAPTAIASIERCPEHRDQRAGACRHCAARRKAGMPA